MFDGHFGTGDRINVDKPGSQVRRQALRGLSRELPRIEPYPQPAGFEVEEEIHHAGALGRPLKRQG